MRREKCYFDIVVSKLKNIKIKIARLSWLLYTDKWISKPSELLLALLRISILPEGAAARKQRQVLE